MRNSFNASKVSPQHKDVPHQLPSTRHWDNTNIHQSFHTSVPRNSAYVSSSRVATTPPMQSYIRRSMWTPPNKGSQTLMYQRGPYSYKSY